MFLHPESACRCRWRDQSGFTLIEVLVAFTVLAALLAVMYRSVVTVRAGSVAFDARTQAAVVARSVLAEILVDRHLAAGTRHGTRDGRGYTVTVRSIDLSGSLPPPPPAAPPSRFGAPQPTAPTAPKWVPQRVVVDVETGGRPVETEVVRLVRAEPE